MKKPTNDSLSEELTKMYVESVLADRRPNLPSEDAFSMRFSTVYASGEEEMDEWQKILHPDRTGE